LLLNFSSQLQWAFFQHFTDVLIAFCLLLKVAKTAPQKLHTTINLCHYKCLQYVTVVLKMNSNEKKSKRQKQKAKPKRQNKVQKAKIQKEICVNLLYLWAKRQNANGKRQKYIKQSV
jgi:hypothetical protein